MAEKTKIQYVNFYSAGSAARKFDLIQPVYAPQYPEPEAVPRRKKRLVVRVDPLALASIAVSVVMLVLMVVGVFQLNSAWQQEKALADYVQQLRTDNRELEQTYRTGYDLEQIEQEALALGMIPVDQAQHITMQVDRPAEEQPEQTPWDMLAAFFGGLFA